MIKYVFIDVETTGLDPETAGIIQLSAIFDIDGEVVDTFSSFMKPFPDKTIAESALKVTGTTLEMISGYPEPEDAFKEFKVHLNKFINSTDRSDKAFFVGYNNLRFDTPFIRRWFLDNKDNYYGSYFHSNPIDVYALMSEYLKHVRGGIRSFNLTGVAKAMDIEFDAAGAHDAMFDIDLTRKMYRLIAS